MRHFVAPAILLLLAACQTDPMVSPPDDPSDACGAAALQHLVGQPVTAFPPPAADDRNVRIIGPDMAVTMDYNPERLNVEYDARRIITRITCG